MAKPSITGAHASMKYVLPNKYKLFTIYEHENWVAADMVCCWPTIVCFRPARGLSCLLLERAESERGREVAVRHFLCEVVTMNREMPFNWPPTKPSDRSVFVQGFTDNQLNVIHLSFGQRRYDQPSAMANGISAIQSFIGIGISTPFVWFQ